MKKLKALEIIKDHIVDLEGMALIFEEYSMYKTKDETKKAIQELTEAIEKLEALETKECYSCKSWSQEFQSIGICDKGIKEEKNHRETMTYHNFCCNKWEVKNEF
ncbi:hypothetical protein [Aliarcobacter butzleri]|uniref:hypothetical protein n=1 Tax=Aliarcobacter butzleri TaxID=28197 RepID=UPI0012FA1188|nr:hypothetical protein [Aliarcobacter butzleri]